METFFDSRQVYEVLDGFNLWWKGRSASVPEYRRSAYYACRRYLDNPTLKRAILLSGARRVGKTTVLLQVANALVAEGREPKSVLYLSLDHPVLKLLSLPDVLRIYHERLYPEGKPATLLLDEVQYSPDWETYIKHLVDFKPFCRILATGSASVVHRHRLAESGVGRWVRVPMPTLSFYEFAQFLGEAPPDLPAGVRLSDLFECSETDLWPLAGRLRLLMPLFERYLLVGGFPDTARERNLALSQRLVREDVVERVLRRDLTELLHVRSVGDVEKLFLYLCIHSGGILAVEACASALGCSPTTITNHLEVLEQANLIYRLSPYRLGGKKALKARHKVYLVDAALRNAVLMRGEDILKDPNEMGIVVETTVLRHLFAFHAWETPRLSYWRDSATGKEVDMIVGSPRGVVPVEVKYRSQAPLTEDDGIVRFCRNERVPHAFWVTQREQDFGVVQFPGLETKFLRIPAHIFCYLLGQAEQPAGWE